LHIALVCPQSLQPTILRALLLSAGQRLAILGLQSCPDVGRNADDPFQSQGGVGMCVARLSGAFVCRLRWRGLLAVRVFVACCAGCMLSTAWTEVGICDAVGVLAARALVGGFATAVCPALRDACGPALRDVSCYDQRARSVQTYRACMRPTYGREASNPQEAAPPTSGHEVPIHTGSKHPTYKGRSYLQDFRISSSRWMRGGRSYLRISQRMSKSTAS